MTKENGGCKWNMEYVINLVRELVTKHGTCDPVKIAKLENIKIEYDFYEETKGYFIKILEYKYIVINQQLNYFLALFVIAHELAHALMHSDNFLVMKYEKGVYHSTSHDVFISNCIYEKEANLFAIQLLKNYFKEYQASLPEELKDILTKYQAYTNECIHR